MTSLSVPQLSTWLGILHLLVAGWWIGPSSEPSQAHPWGGLVVDATGTLYFTFVCPMEGEEHYACVWRIDEGDPTPSLVSSYSPSDIVLQRTPSRQLYAGERFGSGQYRSRLWGLVEEQWREVVAAVPDGARFSVDSYAVSDAGLVVFSVENRLFTRDRDGNIERVLGAHEFERIGPMAWSDSGELFAISDGELLVLGLEEETVEVRASQLKQTSPAHLPFSGANILFDIAVAPDGTSYVAYYGNRQLLSVSPTGVVSVMVQSNTPWSPHGVDFWGEHVYFLESTVGANPWWKFWAEDRLAPRVRRVSVATGIVETIYDGL